MALPAFRIIYFQYMLGSGWGGREGNYFVLSKPTEGNCYRDRCQSPPGVLLKFPPGLLLSKFPALRKRLDVDDSPESAIVGRRTDRFLSYKKHPTDAWLDKNEKKAEMFFWTDKKKKESTRLIFFILAFFYNLKSET